MRRIFLALLVAAAAGCASVKISEVGGRTMTDIQNTSWYFLNLIPLASGNPENPNGNCCKLFRTTTTIENNMKLLDYAVRKTGAEGFDNLVSYTTDEIVLFILFKRHTLHTSAELQFNDRPVETSLPKPETNP